MVKLSSRDVEASSLVTVRIKNNILYCEQARTEQEKQTGLMFRRYMAHNRGMLFETLGRYRPIFYMKNTFLPLDAIFVGNNNKVVDIIPMLPLDASTIYTTRKNIPIKYVIEVHRYYCSSHGIRLDDLVFI